MTRANPEQRVTTTETTALSHTFTFGDAPLMQTLCPDSCEVAKGPISAPFLAHFHTTGPFSPRIYHKRPYL